MFLVGISQENVDVGDSEDYQGLDFLGWGQGESEYFLIEGEVEYDNMFLICLDPIIRLQNIGIITYIIPDKLEYFIK